MGTDVELLGHRLCDVHLQETVIHQFSEWMDASFSSQQCEAFCYCTSVMSFSCYMEGAAAKDPFNDDGMK